MAWKVDDKGNFVKDDNGNPVFTLDSGEDKSVDYLAMSKSLREANAEAKNRKDELKTIKEKLAIFDGIEDLSGWKDEAMKAIEAQKNAPEKDKEVEAQITERIKSATNSLNDQLAAKDRKMAEKDAAIGALTQKLHALAIKAEIQASKVLNERLAPEDKPLVVMMLQNAGAVDDDNKVFFKYPDGTTIYGAEGNNATVDEAISLLMVKMGIDPKKKILSQDTTSGSGSKPGQNGMFSGEVNPWKKETWNLTKQCEIKIKDPALAERMKAAAGS